MQTSRFQSLDVLRGIAALAVAMGHFIIDGAVPVNGVIVQATQAAVIWNFSFIYAVDFFLVLSGFILAHSYFHNMQVSFKDFALRRFLRLYPLHLLTLLFTIGLVVWFDTGLSLKPVLMQLFFIHNIGFGPDGLSLNVPAWTISVEFWINIGVFAVLAKFTPRLKPFLISCGAIALFCYIMVSWKSGHLDVSYETYKRILNAGLLRCLAAFLLGLMTYEAYLKLSRWTPRGWMVGLSALLFLTIIMCLPGHSAWGFAVPPLFAVMVLVFARSEQALERYTAQLVYLGQISFTLYLVHHPILRAFRETGLEKNAVTGMLFLAVILIVAALVHRVFEQPVYRWALRKTARYRGVAERPEAADSQPPSTEAGPIQTTRRSA